MTPSARQLILFLKDVCFLSNNFFFVFPSHNIQFVQSTDYEMDPWSLIQNWFQKIFASVFGIIFVKIPESAMIKYIPSEDLSLKWFCWHNTIFAWYLIFSFRLCILMFSVQFAFLLNLINTQVWNDDLIMDLNL